MARRKTFTNMRVRGTLQVDTLLVHKSIQQTPHLLYLAKLHYETLPDQLTVSEAVNQFGPLAWVHHYEGGWAAQLNRPLDPQKFFGSTVQQFFDADGVLILPEINMGLSLTTGNAVVSLDFKRLDGTMVDPIGFDATIHFVVYR